MCRVASSTVFQKNLATFKFYNRYFRFTSVIWVIWTRVIGMIFIMKIWQPCTWVQNLEFIVIISMLVQIYFFNFSYIFTPASLHSPFFTRVSCFSSDILLSALSLPPLLTKSQWLSSLSHTHAHTHRPRQPHSSCCSGPFITAPRAPTVLLDTGMGLANISWNLGLWLAF